MLSNFISKTLIVPHCHWQTPYKRIYSCRYTQKSHEHHIIRPQQETLPQHPNPCHSVAKRLKYSKVTPCATLVIRTSNQ
ncbi:hypothetical protein EUGRSUZ_L02645 [Eucalyptus grandis]|uniref:Uncharacterized protein n=1 Tax=Eucalyptus grandis TaxID=71139 RepID=A0AAD9T9F5_EUCGR|nr:hypothetical protein EUGRSUZ_L02645 [Eucalyptus grandis]